MIRAPVHSGSYTFYAHVEFLENADLRNLSKEDLLARVPTDYGHSFLLVVDSTAIAHPDFFEFATPLTKKEYSEAFESPDL